MTYELTTEAGTRYFVEAGSIEAASTRWQEWIAPSLKPKQVRPEIQSITKVSAAGIIR